MPELPEVETTARLIRPHVVGRVVRSVELRWPRTLATPAPDEFTREACGCTFRGVSRRGKFVILETEGIAILVHLRMTGRLVFVKGSEVADERWVRMRFQLKGGDHLDFVDPRKFGRVYGVGDLAEVLGDLGPEPLDSSFTASWLRHAIRSRDRLLKPLLLDQAFLAGLGNIYVDESLHRAGLHPLRRASTLKTRDAERLVESIRMVLLEAIEREGSSFDTFYRTPEGRPGSYQDQFQVYGRDGKPCRTCGTTIQRIVVGQRGTHVCATCQRKPRRTKPVRVL